MAWLLGLALVFLCCIVQQARSISLQQVTKCPPNTIHLTTSRIHCMCPQGQTCTGIGCRRTFFGGEHRHAFELSCEECECSSIATCAVQLLPSTIRDCEKTALWPTCTASLWGWDIIPLRQTQTTHIRQHQPCTDVIGASGHWVVPCAFEPLDLNYRSQFPPQSYWQPDAPCPPLKYFRDVSKAIHADASVADCLSNKVLGFFGDSTLRGLLERITMVCGSPDDPAVWHPKGTARHNNAHLLLHRCNSNAFYQYYPALEGTDPPLTPWPHTDEVFLSGHNRLLINYFHSMLVNMLLAVGSNAWPSSQLYLAFGGLSLHREWVLAIHKYTRHKGSLLYDKARSNTVTFIFKANHLRGSLFPAVSATRNEELKAIVEAATNPSFRWLNIFNMSLPFWPHLVRPDHCLCHFHFLSNASAAQAAAGQKFNLHGPVNDAMTNLLLNGICG